MYDDILVPTDGSEEVGSVIDHAVTLARDTGARLHGLYVVDTATATAVPEAQWTTMEEFLEDAGEQALGAFKSRTDGADVPVRTALRHGTPHQEILAYVDEHDIDLVVMGTHGRSGIDRVLLGSVTEKVIRQATVPVLVTRIDD